MVASFLRFLYHTKWHTTVGRIPLDEWSARRRDLYLTHNPRKRQTSMPPAGFELAVAAGEWRQTLALDSSATGIGNHNYTNCYLKFSLLSRYSGQCDQPSCSVTTQLCQLHVRGKKTIPELETFPLEKSPADSLCGATHSLLLPTGIIIMALVMRVIIC